MNLQKLQKKETRSYLRDGHALLQVTCAPVTHMHRDQESRHHFITFVHMCGLDNDWTCAARIRGEAVQTDVSAFAEFIDLTEIGELFVHSAD